MPFVRTIGGGGGDCRPRHTETSNYFWEGGVSIAQAITALENRCFMDL